MNERAFATRAEKAIAQCGVFSTTFSRLDWLWPDQNVAANEKAERIVQFAFSHGWRAIPGFGETEVLFERRTPTLKRLKRARMAG